MKKPIYSDEGTVYDEEAAMAFLHNGRMVEDRCPICNKRLMRNIMGNEWCLDHLCNYHVRNGRRVSETYVAKLNDRVPRISHDDGVQVEMSPRHDHYMVFPRTMNAMSPIRR